MTNAYLSVDSDNSSSSRGSVFKLDPMNSVIERHFPDSDQVRSHVRLVPHINSSFD